MLLPHKVAAEAKKTVYKPAVIYFYSGEKGDSAFINSARVGIARAETEFRTPVTITRMDTMDNAASAIKKIADGGANPIILLGNQYVPPVMNLADRYPGATFTVIDGLTPPLYPNVQSILFRDHEGAFLVGMIAGKLSQSNLVGFVGGMDIPLIRNFALGFTQGVKYAAPDLKVDVQMVGTTAEAWSNPEKAKSLAKMQYREGADIVFAAAGGSSVGVLEAANEMGKLGIGVDSNQNGLFPGHVLTSLVKRVDVAVYDTLKNSHDGSWSAGVKYLGIKEGALDYAVDQNNRSLISEKLIEEVATAKDAIISGKIVVESYSAK
ncbi:MAG: BMP family ABC transporter substrate-binding protein [Alphaproteobacteria bacterium]|nr:BMP family ABC transporter substrate-binding protein [Alphaproteobacteria bacterium]